MGYLKSVYIVFANTNALPVHVRFMTAVLTVNHIVKVYHIMRFAIPMFQLVTLLIHSPVGCS